MPTITLRLGVHPGTDVLHRVVTVCLRRRMQIVALTYVDSVISLTVYGEERQVGRIDRWLLSLIDVVDVTRTELPVRYPPVAPHGHLDLAGAACAYDARVS